MSDKDKWTKLRTAIRTRHGEARAALEEALGLEDILAFRDTYRFLSNFYPAEIRFEGLVYPSVEHAYQAAKTDIEAIRLELAQSGCTPGAAKRIGKKIKLREGWDDYKLNIMRKLVIEKFKISELRQLLIDTGEAQLVEGNYWHDNFWGICGCGRQSCQGGTNHLGLILMDLRQKIIDESKQ